MAGLRPAFVTGATAKIKLSGMTMAYAQDVSYNVNVSVLPIESMGRFEPISIEPISYNVSGSLAVIRYTKNAADHAMVGAAKDGNGIGKWVAPVGQGGVLSNHINPGKMFESETFDLVIFQKLVQNSEAETDNILIAKVIDCRFTTMGSSLTKRGVLVQQFAFQAVLVGDDSFDGERSGDSDLVV